MRRSFTSYKPVVADDKWVPKADKLLMEERKREHDLILRLNRQIPETSSVV